MFFKSFKEGETIILILYIDDLILIEGDDVFEISPEKRTYKGI